MCSEVDHVKCVACAPLTFCESRISQGSGAPRSTRNTKHSFSLPRGPHEASGGFGRNRLLSGTGAVVYRKASLGQGETTARLSLQRFRKASEEDSKDHFVIRSSSTIVILLQAMVV